MALSPFQGDEERSDGGGGCGLADLNKALIPLRYARVLLPEGEESVAHPPSLRSGTSPGGRRMCGSSPFASLGFFSRREKNVWLFPPRPSPSIPPQLGTAGRSSFLIRGSRFKPGGLL